MKGEDELHPRTGHKSTADCCGTGDERGGELQRKGARWDAGCRLVSIGNNGNADFGSDAMNGDYSGSRAASNRPHGLSVGSRDSQYYYGERHGSFAALEAGMRGNKAAFTASRSNSGSGSNSGNALNIGASAKAGGTVDSAASTRSRDWNEGANTGGCAPAGGGVKARHSNTGGDSIAQDGHRGDDRFRGDVARDLAGLTEAQNRTGVPGRRGDGNDQDANGLCNDANVSEDPENLPSGGNGEKGVGGVLSLDGEYRRGHNDRHEDEAFNNTGTASREAEIIVIENTEFDPVGTSGSGSRSIDSCRGGGVGVGAGASGHDKNSSTSIVSNGNSNSNSSATIRGKNGGVKGISGQRVLDNTVNSDGSVLSSKVFVLNVLLAEDSIPNQKLMVRILEREGHTVEAVRANVLLFTEAPSCHDLIGMNSAPLRTENKKK